VTLTDALRAGFALAHQRVGLVLLDILWKGIWIVITIGALSLAASWITSDLLAISWEDAQVGAVNGLIAAALLRKFWSANHTVILSILGLVMVLSIVTWLLLEAVFRRKFVVGTTGTFHILLLSSAAKYAILIATSLLLIPAAFAGAATIAIVAFVALGFLLTLLDTLIRADATDLLGTDLFRVAGVLGILMSFEGMVAGSLGALLVAGFSNVASSVDAIAMLGAALVAVLFLSLLHSYLLLVRFSAIAIMRQNVVEV
jgi:hypothetical protein